MTTATDTTPEQESNDTPEPEQSAPAQPEAQTAQQPTEAAQDWNTDETADEADATEGKKAKKLISLRVTEDDITQAKALAEELKLGYQTLLCELIHDGLAQREAQLRLTKLTESLKASFPAVNAEEIANSPAVKAANELLNSPAVKAAQELVSSPVVKAAQELAATPQYKAAQDFANTTSANLAALPAVQAARDLATTTSARVIQEFTASPAFKAAENVLSTLNTKDGAASAPEFKQLSQAVADIQATLKKAGLIK